MNKIKKGFNYLKNNGLKKTIKRVLEKIAEKLLNSKREKIEQENYLKWIENNEPTIEEIEKQRNFKFEYEPKISVIVPMYNTQKNYFIELVNSLKGQTYTNWQLCLADGSEKKADYIDEIINTDDRIDYKFLNKNMGISGNSNEALKLATGDYYALLDHDDIIPSFSLFEIVKTINEDKEAEFIYTDEDKIMEDKERRIGPHFKSDYAPDTLRSYNYICHFSIFKKSLMDKLVGFNSEFDGSQDYDIILRATELANRIIHIPKILYHWRINENSVASSSAAKPYAYVAAKKAILASLDRQNIKADIEDSRILGLYRLKYKFEGSPKVSIIILNKDHIKDLKKCITSILKSTYDNYEIIIVENSSVDNKTFEYYDEVSKNSKIKIIKSEEKEFNYSKLNNYGVKYATGDFYLFMNNDVEILSTDDWLQLLIGTANRKDVGAVGGKLIYPDGTIQHAGVVLNFTGVAGHVNAHMRNNAVGYMGRIMIQQNFSAVTGALLMVSKKNFEEVNGFDEDFPVAYNDIDFCLKLLSLGKVNVYDPYIIAYHYESKTRGYEDTDEKKERLNNDTIRLKDKWKDVFSRSDPYFNINFRNDVPDMRVNPEKVKEFIQNER